MIDEVVVGAIAIELVVERGGIEPAAENLPARNLGATEADGAFELLLKLLPGVSSSSR